MEGHLVSDSVRGVPKAAGRRPVSDRQRPDPNDPAVQYVVHAEGFPLETAIEMIYVQDHADNVADAAGAACGERFCEVRIDHDGHILVTVKDLTDADVDALQEIGRECGIEGWVRARRADPAALRAWEQCRHELVRLRGERPEALRGYPGPDSDYQAPPFTSIWPRGPWTWLLNCTSGSATSHSCGSGRSATHPPRPGRPFGTDPFGEPTS